MSPFHNLSAVLINLLPVLYLLSFCTVSADSTTYIAKCPTALPTIAANKDDANILKVLVPNITSFTQFVNCSDPARVRGFCIDVFERALSIVIPRTNLTSNMSIHYTCFNFPSLPTPNGPGYDDMIQFVANGTYDAVVGDVTIGAKRLSQVDFTHPYMESGAVILTKVAPQYIYSPWIFYVWPFSLRMRCTIVGAFAFIGLLICFISHPYHPESKTGHMRHRIVNILLFIVDALVFQEREGVKSWGAQLMVVGWVFFVFLLGASYTAGLSSFFTANSLAPSTQDINCLKGSGKPLGCRRGSIIAKDYLQQRFHVPNKLVELRSLSEFIGNLTKGPDRGGVLAIVDELPYINLMLASSTCSDFSISGSQLTTEGFGFGFNRELNISDAVSIAVLNLTESGCLKELMDNMHMSGSNQCSNVNPYSSQVTWRSLLPVFILLVAVLSVILIRQNYVKRYTDRTRPATSIEMSCSLMDDPPHYMFP